MPAAQKLFLIAWSIVVIIVTALMVLLYVSLLPHFGEIGDWMLWVIRIAMICGTALMLTFTYSWIGRLLSKRKRDHLHERLIVHGDVAAYVLPDGTFVHLSAQHVAAGVPRMLPAPKDEEPETTMPDSTIIDLSRDGMTLMQIVEAAKSMGAGETTKYNRVQRVVAEAKKDGRLPY